MVNGVPLERLEYFDARIAELTQRRNRAQSALDAAVREAEARLDAAVTTI